MKLLHRERPGPLVPLLSPPSGAVGAALRQQGPLFPGCFLPAPGSSRRPARGRDWHWYRGQVRPSHGTFCLCLGEAGSVGVTEAARQPGCLQAPGACPGHAAHAAHAARIPGWINHLLRRPARRVSQGPRFPCLHPGSTGRPGQPSPVHFLRTQRQWRNLPASGEHPAGQFRPGARVAPCPRDSSAGVGGPAPGGALP